MRVDWDTIPVLGGMRPGATRQGIAGPLMSAVRVVTAPGASFADSALHTHDHEQYLVMVAGALQIECAGEQYWVGPGDLAVFAPGTVHGAIGVGAEGAEYFEIFSPARYDQLPGYVGPSPLSYR
jgi:quercetin dioxygenase-like cupin family protein